MRTIIELHYPQTDAKLLDAVLRIFYELRERRFEKAPATSELLNWLEACARAGVIPEDANNIPFPGILLKKAHDLTSYRKSVK